MMKEVVLLPALSIIIFLSGCHTEEKYGTWKQYKGSDESIQYSSLRQVDTSNVKELPVAWEYHTNDADTANSSRMQCNPVIIDGILYGTTPQMGLFAIEANNYVAFALPGKQPIKIKI